MSPATGPAASSAHAGNQQHGNKQDEEQRRYRHAKRAEQEQQKPDIFKEIVKELQVHTKIEEEIFYPAVKRVDSEIAVEAEEEHNIVDWIIAQMKKLKSDDEHYEAKFSTLKENVKHHIQEEEREMFPEAERKLGGQLEALGQEMM